MAKEISRFDTILLDGAAGGKSPNELSASVGGVLSAAECLIRVRAMLSDKSIWTAPEKKALMLHRVYQLVDDLSKQAESTKDTGDFSALMRALDLLRKVLAEQGQATEEELAKMIQLESGVMLQRITAAFRYAREVIAEKYPEAPLDEIEDAFDTGLALGMGEDENA